MPTQKWGKGEDMNDYVKIKKKIEDISELSRRQVHKITI